MSDHKEIAYTIARYRNLACEALLDLSCSGELKAALIFTPDECLVAAVLSNAFVFVEPGESSSLARAYEVRAFGPRAELRWTREGETGTATLLADEPVKIDPGAESEPGKTLHVLMRTYRVWGEAPTPENAKSTAGGSRVPDGWSKLTTGRIGALYVPSPQTSSELVLHAKEYVVRGKSGNAVVLFERLVEFGPASPQEA